MRPVRNHLFAAGIPVENTKGEAETGQEELNIRYAAALACADHHTIAKHAVKEIAWAAGPRGDLPAEMEPGKVGSSSHVHSRCGSGKEPGLPRRMATTACPS
jgi:glutamine synthetase